MYSQIKPPVDVNTCDLYFVVKSNNNTVDIEKIILDIDTNGNIIPAQQISNVPVFTFKSANTQIQFDVKEGDIGIFFNTKKYINSFLTNQNRINPKITKFDKTSGFFLPIGMFNDFDGEGINFKTDKLKSQIEDIDLKANSLKAKIDNTEINGDITITGDISQKGDNTVDGTVNGSTLEAEDGLTQTISVMDLVTSSPITLTIEKGIVK